MTLAKGDPSADRAVLKGLYAALEAGDRAGILDALTPDFVGHLAPGLPFGIGGEHRGPEAMIRDGWFMIGRHWKIRAEVGSCSAMDDGRMVVRGTYRGTSRRAGRPVAAPFIHVVAFADGRISELTQVTDTAVLVEALGDERPLRSIDLSVEGGVAVLALARPEVRNAIDQTVADELLTAALRVNRDPRVRALLICGDGPSLTVGGDIEYFGEGQQDDLGALLREMTTPFHLAFEVLAALDVPIVTAAHGAVAGGGLGLVYAADLVVAAEDARFVTAFAQLGLSGDGGGTWHLPRRIGPSRAAQAYLLNEPIPADLALEWGLVNEVVPAGEARKRAAELAGRLAEGPTRGHGQMRKLLRQSWDRSLPEQLSAEIEALVTTARTADAQRAIRAFQSKQTPTFEGA
jgi:2-(1,2-epoxy-1,2-dihydrophenyl)acetyl-CoA isomerase